MFYKEANLLPWWEKSSTTMSSVSKIAGTVSNTL